MISILNLSGPYSVNRSKLTSLLLSTALFSTAFSSVFVSNNSHANDCAHAMQLKEQAVAQAKQNHLDLAHKTIQTSLTLCERFGNWITLGGIEKARGNTEEAASAYIQAKQLAQDSRQSQMALARYAEMMGALGHPHLGASLLYAARQGAPDVADWIITLNKELDISARQQTLSAHHLTRALNTKAYSNLGVNTAPSINLQLNFKHNSTEPVDRSRFNLSPLVEAFSEKGLKDKHFTLVGHTDSTGTDQYNDHLSRLRAEVIYNELISMDSSLKDRLSIKGEGEGSPLYYNEKDETERMLNRRLEIQVRDEK